MLAAASPHFLNSSVIVMHIIITEIQIQHRIRQSETKNKKF